MSDLFHQPGLAIPRVLDESNYPETNVLLVDIFSS